jgi:CBS domain-containing protein
MSRHGAARLLAQAQITGAPVVDRNGFCVGVLSASDFLRWDEGLGCQHGGPHAVCEWEMEHDEEEVAVDETAQQLSQAPVTVSPGETIGQLARLMHEAHAHRVVVVDDRNRPIGIVTASDILAALAAASEEELC